MTGVPLRVLWFINKIPAVLADAAGTPYHRGGWLDAYIEVVGRSKLVELTVAFPDPRGVAPSEAIDGVRYVGLPAAEPDSAVMRVVRRWRHEVTYKETLNAVRALVTDVQPDLVHLHGAEYGYGLAVYSADVPVLLSIQGSPTAIRRLYLRGVDRHFLRGLSIWEFLRGVGAVHNHLRLGAQAGVEAEIMRSVGHIAGRTDWDKRLSAVMAPHAQYHLCDEPLRDTFYGPRWHREGADPRTILAVVGSYPLKGVSTLLRAFRALLSLIPDATLVLVGLEVGTEHERATLRHIRAGGLGGRVRMTGVITPDSLVSELQRCSVFVNPSHVENGSNTLSEAMLLGVPCVATSAGGMTTTSGYGRGALLVQDGDHGALAGAIAFLLASADEPVQMAGRAHDIAIVRHDRERILGQVLATYRQMVG
jgi:glycosyltransferase involved in cell wall biosynthesis